MGGRNELDRTLAPRALALGGTTLTPAPARLLLLERSLTPNPAGAGTRGTLGLGGEPLDLVSSISSSSDKDVRTAN